MDTQIRIKQLDRVIEMHKNCIKISVKPECKTIKLLSEKSKKLLLTDPEFIWDVTCSKLLKPEELNINQMEFPYFQQIISVPEKNFKKFIARILKRKMKISLTGYLNYKSIRTHFPFLIDPKFLLEIGLGPITIKVYLLLLNQAMLQGKECIIIKQEIIGNMLELCGRVSSEIRKLQDIGLIRVKKHKRKNKHQMNKYFLTLPIRIKDKTQEKAYGTSGSKLSSSIRTAVSHALKTYNIKKETHTEEILGYSFSELHQHIENLFEGKMSWANYGTYWEIDHILPVSAFVFLSVCDIQFKLCWCLANLRPLEKIANRRKGAIVPIGFQEFMSEIGETTFI